MRFDFFIIWFFISPFIILRLYLKNREYKYKANNVIDHINDVWDKEYKDIIQNYGTTSVFIECHRKDFDIIRSNIKSIYERIACINRDYMSKTERLLTFAERGDYDIKEITEAIKLIRRSICMQVDEQLTDINDFLVNEENAHTDNRKMADILDSIDMKYKNNDIYTEVNED